MVNCESNSELVIFYNANLPCNGAAPNELPEANELPLPKDWLFPNDWLLPLPTEYDDPSDNDPLELCEPRPNEPCELAAGKLCESCEPVWRIDFLS